MPRDNDTAVKRPTASTSALSSNLQSVCLGVASRVQLDATREAMSTLAMSGTTFNQVRQHQNEGTRE